MIEATAIADAPPIDELCVQRDLASDAYHRLAAVGHSMLIDLMTSPRHFYDLHRRPGRPQRKPPSPAQRAGTLAHLVTLEPHRFGAHYVVEPKGIDYRTTKGKEWKASIDPALEIISEEQLATAHAQRDAVRAVPELRDLLDDGDAEVSLFWKDDATGVACKCRPDWLFKLSDERLIVLDLKTAEDVSPDGFARAVAKWRYDIQAAHYSDGVEFTCGTECAAFVFGVVTNAYPFIAQAYVLSDDDVRAAGRRVHQLLELLVQFDRSDKWPAFGEGVQELVLPPWFHP